VTQVGTNQIGTVVAGTSPVVPSTTTGGWMYDAATGEIRVNDTTGGAHLW
jgi:hypothetical protein